MIISEEKRQALIEVAQKRLKRYQTMKDAQDSAMVRPRGGVDFDYQVSIDLMQIALDSLEAKAVAQFADDYIFNLRKQDSGERWPVDTKLYVSQPVQVMPVIVLPRLVLSATTRGEREEMQDVRNDDIAAIRAAGFDVREKGIGE